jgi:hypothetical protein
MSFQVLQRSSKCNLTLGACIYMHQDWGVTKICEIKMIGDMELYALVRLHKSDLKDFPANSIMEPHRI